MINIRNTIWILFFLVAFVITPLSIHAEDNPQELLKQYISDLQKNPNDNALREKIIKHVQTMKPAPDIPEEAKKYLSRGIAAMKEAKSKDEFKDAVKEFEKVTLAAPWFANAYYNLGIAQDKAGMYADAIKSLKLYLLAAYDARDAESVKGLIYEIEYRQEKAVKEASPEAIAAKKQKEHDEWLKKLDGSKWEQNPYHEDLYFYFELHGNELSYWIHWRLDMSEEMRRLNPGLPGTKKKRWSGVLKERRFTVADVVAEIDCTLSEDGTTIIQRGGMTFYRK